MILNINYLRCVATYSKLEASMVGRSSSSRIMDDYSTTTPYILSQPCMFYLPFMNHDDEVANQEAITLPTYDEVPRMVQTRWYFRCYFHRRLSCCRHPPPHE